MLFDILVILLILWVIGSLPHWPYMAGRNYGYGPSLLGVVLLIVALFALFGGGLVGHRHSLGMVTTLAAVTPTVDLSPILNVLIQIGALVLIGVVTWGAQRAATWLHVSTQSTLFQSVLAAVDRGIAYGQQVVTTAATAHSQVAVQSAVQAQAVNYVVSKLPGTLDALGMTPAHVSDLVLAKLPAPVAGATP